MKLLASVAYALAVVIPASTAMATVITFEEPGLTAMSNSPGAAVPAASRLSTFFLSSLGVSFSSGAGLFPLSITSRVARRARHRHQM